LAYRVTQPPRIGPASPATRTDAHPVDKPFREGRAWLDGQPVDPYATPAPLDWRQVTFELASPSGRAIRRTHTEWEGSVAEMIVFDAKLTDAERLGVEQYLRRKWLAEVVVAR